MPLKSLSVFCLGAVLCFFMLFYNRSKYFNMAYFNNCS